MMIAARARRGLRWGTLGLVLAGPARAEGPADAEATYAIASGALTLKTPSGVREIAVPSCEPKAIARDGARLYVACGSAGIVVLDATVPAAPVVSSRIPTDGDAVAFHTVNGRVWVEVAQVSARPVDALVPSARAIEGAAAPREAPAAQRPEARPSLIAPPRRVDLWELAIDARSFLPIGNIGFGTVGAASLTRRFDIPLSVRGELSPLGVGFGKQGTIGTAAGHAIVALDTQLFEAGLGIGAATLNDPSGTESSSISFAQSIRIGARDGLSLGMRSNVVVDRDRFALGSLTGDGQIPIAQRWWLLIRGGGGPIGFAYGDLGVRYLIAGDGGPDSIYLAASAGGAGILRDRACPAFPAPCTRKSASYAGPALGLGVEWRF
jgi:hypothetical protein